MSDIDIAERRKPQDGHMSVRHGGRKIDYRLDQIWQIDHPQLPHVKLPALRVSLPHIFLPVAGLSPPCENIGRGAVLDIEAIGKVAHEVGVPWIVDNTIATPYVTKPFEFGADIVTHSATKFLSGHGNAMVGAIVDSGNFDFGKDSEKFPGFNQPDTSYNNLIYAQTSSS